VYSVQEDLWHEESSRRAYQGCYFGEVEAMHGFNWPSGMSNEKAGSDN